MFEPSVFLTVVIGLFSLINPLSTLPVFISLTSEHSEDYKLRTLKKTCLYIVLICLLAYFAGIYLLYFFGITLPALRVAGGLIIFRSGWQLLNLTHKQELNSGKLQDEAEKKDDISFSPLAMPLLAGPGSMSFLITLFANRDPLFVVSVWQDISAILAIVLVAVSIYFIFKYAPRLMQKTGKAGLNAMSKVMGFIVTGMGVQMILTSLTAVAKTILSEIPSP